MTGVGGDRGWGLPTSTRPPSGVTVMGLLQPRLPGHLPDPPRREQLLPF